MQKNNSNKNKKIKKDSIKKGAVKTVVTHGANFHADDLFGVAAVLMYVKAKHPGETWKVVRSLDPKVWEKADILLDVGFVHDAKKNRFDHHQTGGAGKRPDGVPYAAFGLIWKKFGADIAKAKVAEIAKPISSKDAQDIVAHVDRSLVAGFDAFDNGVDSYKALYEDARPFLFVHYLKAEASAEGSKPAEKQNFDKVFKGLLPLATRVIELAIMKAHRNIEAKKIIGKAYAKAKDKRIVVTETYAPRDFNDFPDVLFYVYKNLRGNWAVETVPIGKDTTETKVSLPKAWRGKRDEDLAKVSGIPEAVFCHNSGFLGGATTKEAAIQMAYAAIEQNDKA